MTTHPKREYTPEEIKWMAEKLWRWPNESLHEAYNMLECLASQLAAQKREDDALSFALFVSKKAITYLNDHRNWSLENIYLGIEEWLPEWRKQFDMIKSRKVNQPPSPDQDREVSP